MEYSLFLLSPTSYRLCYQSWTLVSECKAIWHVGCDTDVSKNSFYFFSTWYFGPLYCSKQISCLDPYLSNCSTCATSDYFVCHIIIVLIGLLSMFAFVPCGSVNFLTSPSPSLPLHAHTHRHTFTTWISYVTWPVKFGMKSLIHLQQLKFVNG